MLNPSDYRPKLEPTRHCMLACIRWVLDFHKYKITEPELFFYADCTDLEYLEDVVYLGATFNKIVTSLSNISLFSICYNLIEDAQQADKHCLKSHIANGEPVIACVYGERLNYNKDFVSKEQRNHFLVVYDYDNTDGTFHFVDPFSLDKGGNINQYIGSIHDSCLFDATWGYIFIDKPTGSKPSRNYFFNKVRESLSSFIESAQNKEYAVWKYLGLLSNASSLNDDTFQRYCSNMYYNLKVLSVFLILHYTSEALELLYPDGEFEAESQELQKEINDWKMMCYGILKIGMRLKKEKALDIQAFSFRQFSTVLSVLSNVKKKMDEYPIK